MEVNVAAVTAAAVDSLEEVQTLEAGDPYLGEDTQGEIHIQGEVEEDNVLQHILVVAGDDILVGDYHRSMGEDEADKETHIDAVEADAAVVEISSVEEAKYLVDH